MTRFISIFDEIDRRIMYTTVFPKKIVLKGTMLTLLKETVPYFNLLDRWEGHKPSYTLTPERLFDGDEEVWEMFVRLFFPYLAPPLRDKSLLETTDYGGYRINPELYSEEEIDGLLDFLLVPEWEKYFLLNDLHEIHQIHTAFTVRPASLRKPYVRSGYNANLALTPNANEETNENGNENGNENANENYDANNENNANNNVYSKLTARNYNRFVGSTKSRKGKTKKKRGTK